ncbi:hypothetical protein [Streptacidiphilus sp. MAP5-3]|uniref:zinc finger domain-containing protein n=1 Tax=unclassified Streptacidiphilus TaxID=2643834 RepID=UPI003513DCA7
MPGTPMPPEARQTIAQALPAYHRDRQPERAIGCPRCHARPGETCHSGRGRRRTTSHIDRTTAWRNQ